jgi:hypothetical protein
MKDLKPNRATTLEMPGRKEQMPNISIQKTETEDLMEQAAKHDKNDVYSVETEKLDTSLFLRNQLDMVYLNAFNSAVQTLIHDRLATIVHCALTRPIEFKTEMDRCTNLAIKVTEAFMNDFHTKEKTINDLLEMKDE